MMTTPVANGIFEEYWSAEVEHSEGWLTETWTCPALEGQPVEVIVPPDVVRDGESTDESGGIALTFVPTLRPVAAKGGSNVCVVVGMIVVAAAVVVAAAPLACRLWRSLTGSCRILRGSALRCVAATRDETAAK